jgi:hypothetical protein
MDLGLDVPEREDEPLISDLVGIDFLCHALLTGVRIWMLDKYAVDFRQEYWYDGIMGVIQLLRE